MSGGTTSFTMLEYFVLGGFFMWPLLLFSVATIAIALERAIFIFYHNLRMDDLTQKTEEYILAGDIEDARTYLSGLTKRCMGARALLALVSRANLRESRSTSKLFAVGVPLSIAL
jgi:biopolymer transport protein ExbB